MAPSLGGTIDSAEFQQATYSLAIVHPTGYPLYLLAGRLWITLFPFGEPSFRINLLSAIFGALAVWVLYATVRHLTRSVLAGAGAAVLFAVQAVPWAQAGVAEVNSLNTLLVGLTFLALLLWGDGRLPPAVPALVYGVALSHHRQALLYAPLVLVLVVAGTRWGRPRRTSWRGVALSVLLLALPFASYVYLPLRADTTDWYSNTPEGFWREVLGESALPVIRGALERPLIPRFRSLVLGQVFPGLPGRALLALGLLGVGWAAWELWRGSRRPLAAREPPRYEAWRLMVYGSAFLLGLLFATLYDILDVGDYLALPVFMWCVLAGAGIAALGAMSRWAGERVGLGTTATRLAPLAIAVAVAGLALFTASRSLQRPNWRVDFSDLDRRTFWRGVQAEGERIPRGAVLVGDWPEVNEARYLQRVEGWRPDLAIAEIDSLLASGTAPLREWLAQGKPVYLLGEQISILSRYTAERQGALWRVTGEQAESATQVPPMTYTVNRRYGESIVLVGYTLEPDRAALAPGDLLKVTLYWKATEPVTERYVVFNHVVDAQGGKIGQKDDEPGRGFTPTVYWKPGEIIADTFPIAIDRNATPGSYRLISGLYRRGDQSRLPAYSPEGLPLGDYVELAKVEVR